ncbi:MmyB family transcriptional regulator, partial [Rhodococcus sp. A5(2022)]|uniref:MmyB family transcriptional regulator n=1 Tax=Rhodococcus sp. A5(2022) TaxID=3003588 RepID=UPI0022CC13BC|nr:hypothetical protein [Rhodococcus sp. A5(2022)]
NAAAARLVAALPDALRKPSVNMIRAGLHPQGFAAVTANFDEWGRHLVTELAQRAESSADATLAALLAAGFVIAWTSRAHGFRPGTRNGPAVAGH